AKLDGVRGGRRAGRRPRAVNSERRMREIYHGAARPRATMAAIRDDPSRASAPPDSGSEGGGRIPWSRSLLLIAVVGPALWLGGVKPWIVPVFALVIAGLLIRRCLRTNMPLRVPALWWLGLLIAGVTLIQWLPLPAGLLTVLAPGLT